MRVFVTGASGWIGSAVVPELLAHGHEVLGLARSDASAAAIEAAGAQVHRGSLDDLASLRAGAAAADGVIHLAYHHDFSDMAGAAELDREATAAFGEEFAGSGRPLVIATGLVGLATGRTATETDQPDPNSHPRSVSAARALELAGRGVRVSLVRLAPTVHGAGDPGFVAFLAQIARERGVAAYIGDGTSRWPAVHRADAASLFRLALESGGAGTAFHGAAEEGVPTKVIAEAIGAGLALPVASVDPADAAGHFGWLAGFFGADLTASSAITRQTLGWAPTGPTLLEDLASGSYTQAPVG